MILNPYSFAVGGTYDTDAQAWFDAVEAVSSITTDNKIAVNAFVVGCKTDGIWTAIKASCLLCAAGDLTGALVPLVGTAPTNSGSFAEGDYSRTTGLLGNGTSKYLNSNRNNNADPQNSRHLSVWRTASESRDATRIAIGTTSLAGGSTLLTTATSRFYRLSDIGGSNSESGTVTGLWGATRSGASVKTGRYNSTDITFTDPSSAPGDELINVFARNGANFSNARISFYSIGENLTLSLLDARLTTLMAALT